jgi:site-specific DNA-methyltransferase (adenine-specific)
MDCIKGMDLLIKNNIKFNAIITDIPYGTTACAWDSIIPFNDMWDRLKKLRKDKTPIILFGSEPFSSALRMSNIKEYKYDWKWNKLNGGNPLIAKHRPLGIFEDIMVFGKGKVNYYPIMEEAKEENKRPRDRSYKKNTDLLYDIKSGEFKSSELHNENLRYPKNEIIVDSRKGELNALNRLHPTQKPVELIEYLIKTYTQENDLILDFTIGSGTTAISCINTNRNFIGFELQDDIYKIAKNRINTHIIHKNMQDKYKLIA